MSKDYRLLEHTDAWVTRPRIRSEREPHLYPSEASVGIVDDDGNVDVVGGCLRSSYLRVTKSATAEPMDARGTWIVTQGIIIEQQLIEFWKQMGVWVDNNSKFYWKKYNVSGEIDAILAEPDTGDLFGVEIKTFYGYNAGKQVMGNKSEPGFPKLNQLLQTLIYTYHYRDKLKYFKLVYFARDDVRRREFTISLARESGGPPEHSFDFDGTGDTWWPVIDGIIYKQFSFNDVMERYKLLQDYIANDQLPPPDYRIRWTDEKVQREIAKGNVSKTAKLDYERAQKTGRPHKLGDWMCSYCKFKDFCWNPDGSAKN